MCQLFICYFTSFNPVIKIIKKPLLKVDTDWLLDLFTIFKNLVQYGIGVPDSVSKAFRIIESLVLLVAGRGLEGHGVLLNDIKDAYQTMDRTVVLKSLYEYKQLRQVWDVANLALRHAGPRYVKMHDGTWRVIFQSMGFAQGATTAALLYCVSSLRDVKAFMSSAGGPQRPLRRVAIMEDVALFGSHEV